MKLRKADIFSRVHSIPDLKFDDNCLTSYAGLITFQRLFTDLDLRDRLGRCFSICARKGLYGVRTIFLIMVVHILLGYRHLRDVAYYKDDPIVLRVLGLRRLPDVGTISRTLSEADEESEQRVALLTRELVLDRVVEQSLARVTLDFDGTVNGTRRQAEGSAAGYNTKRKGMRSYYPLICTLAQTSQILDVLHRQGNVHDSNGSLLFIEECVVGVEERGPGITIESRMDSAFFSQDTVLRLQELGVEFTITVPFERLVELKRIVESTRRWKRLDDRWSYREVKWKPKSWSRETKVRIILVRQKVRKQRKGALQLDLFKPRDWEHEYKVIVTNKHTSARHVVAFHNGRGTQEGIIGEVKSNCSLDYIPCRKLIANQLYLRASVLAHNLGREIQMRIQKPSRGTTPNRTPKWVFQKLTTFRHNVICRAGRMTRPGGRLTLTMNANKKVEKEIRTYLSAA